MPAKVSLSFRVDDQTLTQLDQLAEAIARPRSWVLGQALQTYLKIQAWQVEDIRQALAEADDTDFAADEEMAETFASFDRSGGEGLLTADGAKLTSGPAQCF